MIFRFLIAAVALIGAPLLPTIVAAADGPSTDPILRIETGQHTAPIHALAISPDGAQVATTGDDKTIRIWRTADGEPIETIRVPIGSGDEGILYSLAFSPSGRALLAGGISGVEWSGRNQVYIVRPTEGEISTAIPLSGVVRRIAYGEADGETRIGFALSAAKGGAIQIRNAKGKILFQDLEFEGAPSWLDFTPEGHLAVVETGGRLRVYDAQDFSLRTHKLAGDQPAIVRPSPDGTMLAVGYYGRRSVDVFDARTFRTVATLAGNVIGGKPHLNAVTWRASGGRQELWAGGAFANAEGLTIVRRWPNVSDPGLYIDIPVSEDAVTALETTPGGMVIFAASDPIWGAIDGSMKVRYAGKRQGPDFRLVYDRAFAVSPDGQEIAFSFEQRGTIGTVAFKPETSLLRQVSANEQKAIADRWTKPAPPAGLQNWRISEKPTLNGAPLNLLRNERSLAADQVGEHIIIGADRGIYAFSKLGKRVARTVLNAAAFGIIALDDNRFIAALGDGTLRWYRLEGDKLSESGAFFLSRDQLKWLAWTPDGRFAHSENGGQELAGYHINRGGKEEAEWAEFSQHYRTYFDPEAVRIALTTGTAPTLETEVASTLSTPQIELLAFCPVSDGVEQDCVEAKLAKRGLGAILEAEEPSAPEAGARAVTSGTDAVLLKFKVSEYGDKLASVDVFQNGRTTGRTTRGLGAIEDAESEEDPGLEITRLIPLRIGLNRLQVRAYNSAGVYGLSDELELFRPEEGQTEQPTLHVLVVGADSYDPAIGPLAFAKSDAETILNEVSQSLPDVYADVKTEPLYNEDVTREGVLEAMQRIAERSAPEDAVLVYFAGHGVQTDDGVYRYVTPEITTREQLLTRSVDQDAIIEGLSGLQAQNVLLMLDTCYSGSFPAAAAGTINNETGFMVLSASNKVEEALDGYDGQNGVFAYAVKQALGGAAAGPTGMTDATNLGTYVRDLVPILAQERSHTQRPQLQIQRSSNPFPVAQRQIQ
ncbi:MAG: caspase family protein [Pseudomonadota bacterium]